MSLLKGRQNPDVQGTHNAYVVVYATLMRLLQPSVPMFTPEKQKVILISMSTHGALKHFSSPKYKWRVISILFV